jgi:multiple antibiotic resistance protein
MKRLTAIVALTLVPFAAAAQSAGVLATKRPITWGMIFALLFLMLGPIKLLGPFAAATKECDRVFRLRLATRAFLFSAAAVTIAGALGEQMLDNFAIPVQVLQIAAGLILFLVALQAVMHQYDVTRPPDRTEPPTLAHAFSPLAFPTIVTPYGIAAVIILIALAPTTEVRLMVAGVADLGLALSGLPIRAARSERPFSFVTNDRFAFDTYLLTSACSGNSRSGNAAAQPVLPRERDGTLTQSCTDPLGRIGAASSLRG